MIKTTHIDKLKIETSSPEFRKRMEEFVSFMEQPIDGRRFIDALRDIVSQPVRFTKLDNIENLTLDEAKELVASFYASIDSNTGERVAQILNNNDPQVNLAIVEDTDVTPKGNVNHSGMNQYVTLNCTYDNTIYGSIVLAHETGHSISNNLTILAKLSQKMAQTPSSAIFESYLQHRRRLSSLKPLNRDAVAEIESHIFESLYCDYLLQQGVIDEEYIDNFQDMRQASLYNNILTLLEDYTCIKGLRYPITQENLQEQLTRSELPIGHIQDFLRRFEDKGFMFQHRIKYVIGEIVSTNWINKYHTTSSQRTRSQMKHRLLTYLDKCYSYDVESACKQLLNNII